MSSTLLAPATVFFYNDTAPTEISPLSLHAALPISGLDSADPRVGSMAFFLSRLVQAPVGPWPIASPETWGSKPDRKSTRLNSSHLVISYAVFCLKTNRTFVCTPRYAFTAAGGGDSK